MLTAYPSHACPAVESYSQITLMQMTSLFKKLIAPKFISKVLARVSAHLRLLNLLIFNYKKTRS